MARCTSIIKRLIPATCSWIVLLSTTAAFFIFPCRRLHEEYHYSITIAQAIITFFVISNLFATTFVEPGIIRRADKDEDKGDPSLQHEVQIQGQVVRMKWCSTCQFYRPPRCSHCSVCDNCIEKFDHHCPWVNNCIGRRNYRHFFFFLICLTIHMITIFIWCLILVINNGNKTADTVIIVAIVLLVIISIFFIPIVGLTGFHVWLVIRGRTTNEEVTGKFKRQVNPFDKGIFYNCAYDLCGPRYPGMYKYNKSACQQEASCHGIKRKSSQNRNRRGSIKTPESKILDTGIITGVTDADTRPGGYAPKGNIELLPDNSYALSDNPKDSLLHGRREGAVFVNEARPSVLRKPSKRNDPGTRFPTTPGGDSNGLKKHEQDSHVVTMHHTENGTKETTFIALPSSAVNRGNEPKPATGMFHPAKIGALKSTSINEISSHLKPSPAKTPANIQGPEGGMLIYYSPDAGGVNYPGVGSNKLFNSETELQNYGNYQLTGGANQFLYIDEEPPPATAYMMKTTTATTITTSSSTNSDNYHHHHHGRFYTTTAGGTPTSSTNKKPMPFQKALEMSNKIDQQQQQQQQQKNQENTANNNRQSQYEMNYEISV